MARTHGVQATYKWGFRCPKCKAVANADRVRSLEDDRADIADSWGFETLALVERLLEEPGERTSRYRFDGKKVGRRRVRAGAFDTVSGGRTTSSYRGRNFDDEGAS